jgi:Flp pilus assembly protein TadG
MRKSEGQVLVETAIILPILFILIFGIIDFGLAMFMQNTLASVAGSGARTAVVTTPLNPETTNGLLYSSNSITAQTIQNNLTSAIPFSFYQNKAVTAVTYKLESLDPVTGATLTGPVQSGNMVRVTLSWQSFPTITPLYNILKIVTGSSQSGSNSLSLSGAASMRYE